ncbi:MAG: TonB-dependent receptor [Kangiellaceae bacterium]
MPHSQNKSISCALLKTKRMAYRNYFKVLVPAIVLQLPLHTLAEQTGIATTTVSQANISNSIYQVSFFQQYSPQNALDMVQRLPGFKFDQGENNRGFGGNAGNVLVDGLRPTSKSGGLSGALVRIPAALVERIEILRGGVAASEASGQSVVANIIKKTNQTSGTWAAKLRRAPDGNTQPNIEAAISTNLGDWETAFDMDTGGGPGYREATIENRDHLEQLISSSEETFENTGRWFFSNGQGSKEYESGTLTLNGRIGGDRRDTEIKRDIFNFRLPDQSPIDKRRLIDEDRKFKMAELGVDWLEKSETWKMHLIGLGVVRDFQYENQVLFEDFSDDTELLSNFEQESLKTEMIVRATFGYGGENKLKPEYGFEIAQNKLRKESTYLENGEQVALNGADVDVQELRSEIFATFVYPWSDVLTVEGGITGEFSEIKVTGEVANRRNFKFLKPRLSATYKLNTDSQIAIAGERSVGQLDFNDFAASNQAQDGNIVSGNPNLAPDIEDELSLTYDLSFSEKGSLTVKLFHEWQQDILEQIILPSDDEDNPSYGIGNAGDARFWGIVTDINLPLDGFIENGLLEIAHRYRDSEFDDPITNQTRTISGYTPHFLGLKFRQDLIDDQWAWGVDYESHFLDEHFRAEERIIFKGNDRFHAFIETTRFFDLKIQLEVRQINTGEFTRSRYLFDGNRAGPLIESEVSYRTREPEYKFSVWGTF